MFSAARLAQLKVVLVTVWLVSLPGTAPVWQYQLHPQATGVSQPIALLPKVVTIPVQLPSTSPPQLTAQSVLVTDLDTGAVLYAKQPEKRMYPASITKIMTALVAQETFSLDQKITVGTEAQALGSAAGLHQGDVFTVRDLFRGLLIPSGNDAAFVLAAAYPGGYGSFVKRMNTKALELGMTHTTFRNVSGVEQEGHQTTARDLTVLARAFMRQQFLRDTVRMTRATIGEGAETHTVVTTNQLLNVVPGVEGIKTGWTDDAGECLLTQTTRDGHTILVVMLDSKDRFGESTKLINWTFQAFQWQTFTAPATNL